MKFVEWCDIFLIGHPVIDQQHQVLFDIANRFHDVVRKGFDLKTTVNTMNELICYAQKHFSTEEAITHELDMPAELLEHHQEIHDKLVSDIFDLNEKLESGRLVEMEEVEKFIREWLVLHILIEDQKYKEYLNKPRPKKRAAPPQAQTKDTIKYP